MSDFDDQMAEWRKTVWGTGPCQDSSQENFTLTDEEREAIEWFVKFGADRPAQAINITRTLMDRRRDGAAAATLRALLERLGGDK